MNSDLVSCKFQANFFRNSGLRTMGSNWFRDVTCKSNNETRTLACRQPTHGNPSQFHLIWWCKKPLGCPPSVLMTPWNQSTLNKVLCIYLYNNQDNTAIIRSQSGSSKLIFELYYTLYWKNRKQPFPVSGCSFWGELYLYLLACAVGFFHLLH